MLDSIYFNTETARTAQGRLTIWLIEGQGPTVLAVGAGGGCMDICTIIYSLFLLSPRDGPI